MVAKCHQLGQKKARSTKPGRKQHGQYRMPSIQSESFDGFACQALAGRLDDEPEDEPVYELPDSVLGPLR